MIVLQKPLTYVDGLDQSGPVFCCCSHHFFCKSKAFLDLQMNKDGKNGFPKKTKESVPKFHNASEWKHYLTMSLFSLTLYGHSLPSFRFLPPANNQQQVSFLET